MDRDKRGEKIKSDKKARGIDMTEGPVLSKLLLFALPLILTCLLQLAFNSADIIVVGKFAGDDALAAVGSTSSLINLLTNFFFGLSVGANVLAARFRGGRNGQALKETVHTAILISFLSGLFLMVVFYFLTGPILRLMLTPPTVLPKAALYMRIYALGMPAMMIYNFGSALLRAKGDTKRPLFFLALSGIVNVGLNLLFVIRLRMDVAGVAYATAIAQTLSAFMILFSLGRENDQFRLQWKELKIYSERMKGILQIGLPAGIQGVLFAVSNVVIQAGVNSFGAVIAAAGSASMTIEGLVYFITYGFDQAALSFVSQNMGAGRYDRMHTVIKTSLLCTFVSGSLFGVLASLAGRPLLSAFTDTEEVLTAGLIRLVIICLGYGLCGLMDTMASIMRGIGYSVLPTVVTLLGVCAFRVVWIFFALRTPTFNRPEYVYISYPVSWLLTTLVESFILKKIWQRDILPKVHRMALSER